MKMQEGLFSAIRMDIACVEVSWVQCVLSNRGFHALLVYRLSNWLYKRRIPLVPMILTRIIQILYAIDKDYRAEVRGGVVIVHGMGLVIGAGALLEGDHTKLYHGVTLGVSESDGDRGFPSVGRGVLIGAGAKVLGNVQIGNKAKIGANAVVLKDVPEGCVAVGIPARII